MNHMVRNAIEALPEYSASRTHDYIFAQRPAGAKLGRASRDACGLGFVTLALAHGAAADVGKLVTA